MNGKEAFSYTSLCALVLVAWTIGSPEGAMAGGGDDCFSAPVTVVPVGELGSPIITSISGDNTLATCDTGSCPPNTDLGWYEAFEIDTCAKITIDFCGEDPVSRATYSAIWRSCPLGEAILADSFSRAAPCNDFNAWMQFDQIPPGQYWFRIYTIPGDERCENGNPATCDEDADCPSPYTCQDNIGPYTFHITAEALLLRPDSPVPTNPVDGAVTAVASTAGPDIIISNVFGCQELGREGPHGSGTMGMSCWTTACTVGDQGTDWHPLPDNNHPMITVNLYRLSTLPGAGGADRLVQLGHSWMKHAYLTVNDDECGLGCTPGGHASLNNPGCSDTYSAAQFVPCDLGPRSIINPYTGVMPPFADLGPSPGCVPQGVESNSAPANDHRDHVHNEISHRLQVQDVDLNPAANPGALYFAEAQYIVPHEFVAGNGTQNNNVSYRHISVAGDAACGGLLFDDVGSTAQAQPALNAWPGATQSLIEPAPLADGRGFLAYEVTNLGGGQWHYEYALYNMNLDRAMSSLSIPLTAGAVVSNAGFSAPPHHAPEPHADNYSNAPWTLSIAGGAITWSTNSFGADPMANAVRFGTLYNFWFDADTPPQPSSATIGLFKTGGSAAAPIMGPGAPSAPNPPIPDPSGLNKTRFVSFVLPAAATAAGGETALRIRLNSLHHVEPPYAGGPSVPFTGFEGQVRWAGPPTQYLESSSSGVPFHASPLQCMPHYRDWSTLGLLHVTGSAITPSSGYEVENVAASCMGNEANCTAVSAPLSISTTRWGDVRTPYNPPDPSVQPDISDVSALVDKFRGAPGAPIKARAILAGEPGNPFGEIMPAVLSVDFGFSHISACVDAFRGGPYPYTIRACP